MKTVYKVDLHSHSIISHDGGITAQEYEKVLQTGKLDCIAITDHNETRFARIMQEKLGEKIIIGEEVTTTEGEIIGLFLKETVPAGLSPEETVAQIHKQGGLVCIPHPYEVFRKGLKQSALDRIRESIDIVEVFNGRGIFRGKPQESLAFANQHTLAMTASSDAHCRMGLGITYSSVTEFPTQKNLKHLLEQPILERQYAPIYTLFCPFINRLKNKIILTND